MVKKVKGLREKKKTPNTDNCTVIARQNGGWVGGGGRGQRGDK